MPKHSVPATADPAPVRSRRLRSLTASQQEEVLAALNSERFVDCSPRQLWATLLDEDVYLCSWRTMYRLLANNQQAQERRNQRQHPKYSRCD